MSIKPSTPAENVAAHLKDRPDESLPDNWWNWTNVLEAHDLLAQEFLDSVGDYPCQCYAGRGIVICGGGHRLFTNAWVCMRMLRYLGVSLPIELWHLDGEMDSYMAALMAPWGVTCVDARERGRTLPRQPRILNGWELKPFALLHSHFEETLLLDADNVPVMHPEILFVTPQYLETGAIFWPDFGRMEETRGMWRATGVPFRDEPEFESGQIVVDKSRAWRALNLTVHYNEHSDFYYQHVHGDKCTFRFAWHRTQTPFAMPPYPIHALDATMCQHDFWGRRIFQHRNFDKWRLDGQNRAIEDFWFEDGCLKFLSELRDQWSGQVYRRTPMDAEEQDVYDAVAGGVFEYERVGYDSRPMELNPDGTIGDGADERERYWAVNRWNGNIVLTILGGDEATCHLRLDGDSWTGHWLHFEQMPIRMTRIHAHRREAVATGG